ncbi:MAG: universal stress protein [Rhizobiales bacterium]|nr:universal stress protein [Hyphomicrobiales bacterium]
MQTILVPVDGSVHALKALRIACDLAEKYGGKVTLLHVLVEGRSADELLDLHAASTFGPVVTAQLRESAAQVSVNLLEQIGLKILDQAATETDRRGLETDQLPIAIGDPVENILIALKQSGASTIVMGSRGAARRDPASFGSVSQAIFARANCTCLSVK